MFNINTNNSFMAINYNSSFITTYKSFDEPYYNDLCYKIQLLQAFNMIKYDEFMLQQNIQKTYYSLREEEKIQKIMSVLSQNNKQLEIFKAFSKDFNKEAEDLFYFQILFSFDYFDLFHKFLCIFLKKENDLRENELNENLEQLLQHIISAN
jgi:hypothetical protein